MIHIVIPKNVFATVFLPLLEVGPNANVARDCVTAF